MRKHEVKIKDEENFVKDLDNNAILNTDIKGLNLYKMKKLKLAICHKRYKILLMLIKAAQFQ